MVFHFLPPFYHQAKTLQCLECLRFTMYSTMVFAARVPLALTLMHTQLRCCTLEVRKNGSLGLAHKKCKHSNLCSIFSMHHVRRHGTNTFFVVRSLGQKKLYTFHLQARTQSLTWKCNLVCTNHQNVAFLHLGIPLKVSQGILKNPRGDPRWIILWGPPVHPGSQWTGGIQY